MGMIQINAIRSWLSFCPPCEILLLGDDEGTAEIADQFGVRHIPDIDCNEATPPITPWEKQNNLAPMLDEAFHILSRSPEVWFPNSVDRKPTVSLYPHPTADPPGGSSVCVNKLSLSQARSHPSA